MDVLLTSYRVFSRGLIGLLVLIIPLGGLCLTSPDGWWSTESWRVIVVTTGYLSIGALVALAGTALTRFSLYCRFKRDDDGLDDRERKYQLDVRMARHMPFYIPDQN